MAKKYFFTATLFFIFSIVFSQDSLFFKEFKKKLSKNEFDVTLNMIDSEYKKSELSSTYKKYDLKGHVYKKKYEVTNNPNDYDSCFFYFSKAKTHVEKMNNENEKDIKSLGAINYNKAGKSLNNLQLDSAEFYFLQYKKTANLILDSANYKSKEIEFYLACGSSSYKLYMTDKNTNNSYFDRSIEYLKKALKIDSNNFSANYNIAIFYFNQGVNNIENAESCKQIEIANSVDWSNTNKPIPSIKDLLECVKRDEYEKYNITPPFKKALPYALKAYQLKPDNKNIRVILSGIYFCFEDFKNYGKYGD